MRPERSAFWASKGSMPAKTPRRISRKARGTPGKSFHASCSKSAAEAHPCILSSFLVWLFTLFLRSLRLCENLLSDGTNNVVTENAVAREIVDAAYHIHTVLGPGLLESVYETVLTGELQKRGLRAATQ